MRAAVIPFLSVKSNTGAGAPLTQVNRWVRAECHTVLQTVKAVAPNPKVRITPTPLYTDVPCGITQKVWPRVNFAIKTASVTP